MKYQSNLFSKLTTHNLLIAIVFIAIFTMAVRIPTGADTWWHMRSGQYVVENQTLFRTDPFSHTRAGQLWMYPKLGQVFWYALYSLGGWGLVSLSVAALATLAFWFVWKQIEANVFVGACSMILGAIVSSVVWVARPQMFSLVLTALIAYLLYRFKRHNGKLLPWVPLVMLLWINIHGGFAIGFMLMLAYLVGEILNHLTLHQDDPVVPWNRLKHLILVMLISLVIMLINPHTWRMLFYPFQTVGISALREFVAEWQSPDFHLSHAQPFIVMLLLIVVALARINRQADWTDLTLVALWTGWSLFAARNIAVFGVVTTPILAHYADIAWRQQWHAWGYQNPPFAHQPKSSLRLRTRTPTIILNWILLALIVVAALIKIAAPLNPEVNLETEQNGMPYQAVEFMKNEQPPGPMFNSYNWGGYLIFKLWPDYAVYIDGRTDLYDDAFFRRFLAVMVADEGWEQILTDDGINLIFIEANSTLVKFLEHNRIWHELYRDEKAVIFRRVELLP